MTERGRTLTVAEAAEYLQLHPEVVRRKARSGELKAWKLGKGRRGEWRFRLEDLNQLFRHHGEGDES